MDVEKAIIQRRSVRDYTPEPIEEEKLFKVLEAARMAPSAHNAQLYKLIIVRDEDKKSQLAEAANSQTFVAEAPIVIAAVALDTDKLMTSGAPIFPVDVAIAVDHMTLQAAEEGLGTCWIGAFDQDKVREILNVPDKYFVVMLMPLGYPGDRPGKKSRKSLDDIICFDEFHI